MPNRFTPGCCCCQDCIDITYDFTTDRYPVAASSRIETTGPTETLVTLVFDVSDETGFGVVHAGDNALLSTMSADVPFMFGGKIFEVADDYEPPTSEAEFDAEYLAAPSGNATPTAVCNRIAYMVTYAGHLNPSEWGQVLRGKLVIGRTSLGASSALNWAELFDRESEGVYVTRDPIPGLTLLVKLQDNYSAAKNTPKLDFEVSVEFFTKDGVDETQLFQYSVVREKVPPPYPDRYLKFLQNTVRHYPIRTSEAVVAPSLDPAYPDRSWLISTGSAGEIIHMQSNSVTGTGELIRRGVISDSSNEYEYLEFLVNRHAIQFLSGCTTGEQPVQSYNNFVYPVEIGDSPVYMRVTTENGLPPRSVRFKQYYDIERDLHENCPYDPSHRRTNNTESVPSYAQLNVAAEKIVTTSGELIPTHYGLSDGLPPILLSGVVTISANETSLAEYGDDLLEGEDSITATFTLVSGTAVPSLPSYTKPKRFEGYVALTFIATHGGPLADSFIESAPGPFDEEIYLAHHRHYRWDSDRWVYEGQTKVAQFDTRPDAEEIAEIAATIINPEDSELFWFRVCESYYTINAEGVVQRARKEDFTPFVPDVIASGAVHYPSYSGEVPAQFVPFNLVQRAKSNVTPITVQVPNYVPTNVTGSVINRVLFDKRLPGWVTSDPPTFDITPADVTGTESGGNPYLAVIDIRARTISLSPTLHQINFEAEYEEIDIRNATIRFSPIL